jgi:hypothetical protein
VAILGPIGFVYSSRRQPSFGASFFMNETPIEKCRSPLARSITSLCDAARQNNGFVIAGASPASDNTFAKCWMVAPPCPVVMNEETRLHVAD